MNEQLKKAIEEATKIQSGLQTNIGTGRIKNYVPEDEHDASQAKLLRVIEMLVEQRNKYIFRPSVLKEFGEKQVMELIAEKDAELIAALGQGRDE